MSRLDITNVFVNGSFTAGKVEPRDVDLLVPIVRTDWADFRKAAFIGENFHPNGTRFRSCHSFPLFEGKEELIKKIWDYFTHDRFLKHVEKGMVDLRVS